MTVTPCPWHHKIPCPVCAGLDMHKPELHEPMADISLGDMLSAGIETLESQREEIRRMLIAFDSIAKIASDMLDPVKRAGPGYDKGMCGLQEDGDGGDDDEFDVEEELWTV
jgi:hypothetical protein